MPTCSLKKPKHHWLVVAPANSPENHFRMADGSEAAISLGPTMLSQLVRYVFGACVEDPQKSWAWMKLSETN